VGVGIKRLVGHPVLAEDRIFDHASNVCFLIIAFAADANLTVRSSAAGSPSRATVVTWSDAAESRRTLSRSSCSLVEYAALSVNVTGLITA
jgi:hypothetical protein